MALPATSGGEALLGGGLVIRLVACLLLWCTLEALKPRCLLVFEGSLHLLLVTLLPVVVLLWELLEVLIRLLLLETLLSWLLLL